MISNYPDKPLKRAENVEVQRIFTPYEGASYSHHSFITFFKGKLYAIWSNGTAVEDDCGQRVMVSSADNFNNWSEPKVLISPDMFGCPEAVLTAAGFYQHKGKLCVYIGYFEYKPEAVVNGMRPTEDASHRNTGCYVICTEDGINFTEPKNIGLKMFFNHPPKMIKSGRIIGSGCTMYPYSDDPSGFGEFTATGIYGDVFGDGEPVDDSESIHQITEYHGWPGLICEGSFFQTQDDVIHMMLRSNTEWLYCTESYDNGETWTEPYKTDFSDCGSKMHFSTLSDGRIYGVSDCVPRTNRCPLTVCITKDADSWEDFSEKFILRDELQPFIFPNRFKGGLYAYPCSTEQDGYLYVSYTVNKEAIEVLRVPIESLR